MNIIYLELRTKDLQVQRDFYADVLELPVSLSAGKLEVQAGTTNLVFTQADSDFDGAYHFAFNIPENQFRAAKEWIAARIPLLRNEQGDDEYDFSNWNAHAFYFDDAAGNILEFIARHDLKSATVQSFNSNHILNVSEIGLPSENVITFAKDICARLGLSVFRGQLHEVFTAVGDDNGLFIISVLGRLWMPTYDPGIPAKLSPVNMKVEVDGKEWEVRGVPYEIRPLG